MIERELIMVKCVDCGNDFEYMWNGMSKKATVCENCKKIRHKKISQRYYQKVKNGGLVKPQISKDMVIVDTSNVKAEKQFLDYSTRVLDLLGQLDTLRVNMCNMIQELSDYQSDYDKKDQDFIHQIELNNFKNGNDALSFVNDWCTDRKSRRNVKNLIRLLRDTVNVIPIKCKFAAINNIQNIKLKENRK